MTPTTTFFTLFKQISTNSNSKPLVSCAFCSFKTYKLKSWSIDHFHVTSHHFRSPRLLEKVKNSSPKNCRPTVVYRLLRKSSANSRPTVGRMSVICWPSTHSINLGIPSSTLLQVILILLLYRFYVKIIFIQYIIECMETLIMQLLILFNFKHLHF